MFVSIQYVILTMVICYNKRIKIRRVQGGTLIHIREKVRLIPCIASVNIQLQFNSNKMLYILYIIFLY